MAWGEEQVCAVVPRATPILERGGLSGGFGQVAQELGAWAEGGGPANWLLHQSRQVTGLGQAGAEEESRGVSWSVVWDAGQPVLRQISASLPNSPATTTTHPSSHLPCHVGSSAGREQLEAQGSRRVRSPEGRGCQRGCASLGRGSHFISFSAAFPTIKPERLVLMV